MISVEEASLIIQNNLWKGKPEMVKLLSSLGRTLAEDALADRDFPPYDRVTMDGIAIAFESYQKGNRKFKIQGIQAAGMEQRKLNSPDDCLEVMTGAILPDNTDTVVRYEDIKAANGLAEVKSNSVQIGDSVHRQGSDAKANSIVLGKGTLISSAEVPLLASVGASEVLVQSLPGTAIISTGDELVDINSKPKKHQVRKSNVYAIAGSLEKFKVRAALFHLLDDEKTIKHELENILASHDLIILSGGVSKGKFDFIPSVLEASGIQKHFHQIRQRPGKPMWFGTGNGKTVFALPGNPVSTFLCYYKYVEPWLTGSLGVKSSITNAILDTDFTFEQALTYFLQVSVRIQDGQLLATPVPGGGSGDFVNLKDVDGFLELPEQQKQFRKGEVYPFISFRN